MTRLAGLRAFLTAVLGAPAALAPAQCTPQWQAGDGVPGIAGLPPYHQFLQFDVGAQGQLSSLSASPGLQLTVGAF